MSKRNGGSDDLSDPESPRLRSSDLLRFPFTNTPFTHPKRVGSKTGKEGREGDEVQGRRTYRPTVGLLPTKRERVFD